MDGMTGYNPDLVREDLNRFNEAITEIYNYAKTEFDNYNKGLLDAWCSPKALELSRGGGTPSDCGLFYGCWIGDDLAELQKEIVASASGATKLIARANGDEFTYDYTQLSFDTFDYVKLKEKGPNGEVGMNHILVDMIVSQYVGSCNKVAALIKNLPVDLHIYDPGGALTAAFKERITKTADIFTSTVEAVVRVVNEIKEQEQDHLTMGVNNAVQTMAG